MASRVYLGSRLLPGLRGALLSWYDKNKRDLPWRNTREPYHVWVSEIMLQQTRVATVVLRYSHFLRKFPSVETLAAARQTSVLAEWSGLGYYRRARNLHASAKIVVREGKFPATAQDWLSLPGIGRYTAAAIASMAFAEPVAVLDGNVERVLRRLLGGSPARAHLWSTAEDLLDRERPGDFNQAMMELGATLCLPGGPRCGDCPISKFCRTRGPGISVSRPSRQVQRQVYFSLARRSDSVLLVRRAKSASLMAGMWELPKIASPRASDEKLFSVRHSITTTDFTVHVIARREAPSLKRAILRDGVQPSFVNLRALCGYCSSGGQHNLSTNAKWVKISRLNKLPLTGLAKKILHKSGIIQQRRGKGGGSCPG